MQKLACLSDFAAHSISRESVQAPPRTFLQGPREWLSQSKPIPRVTSLVEPLMHAPAVAAYTAAAVAAANAHSSVSILAHLEAARLHRVARVWWWCAKL
jgi:hypothetical protein